MSTVTCLFRRPLVVGLLVAAVCRLPSDVSARATGKTAPAADFSVFEAAVVDFLAHIPDYRVGDLLTRKQVEAALDRGAKAGGWHPEKSDREALLKTTLEDGSFLAQQLRGPAGKAFMRQVAPMPGGYDVLDRLSQLAQGRDTVKRLVRGPDGHKLLQYMTETKGGAELERMLARDPQGAGFGKSTGKVYEQRQLIAALKLLHGGAVGSAKPGR